MTDLLHDIGLYTAFGILGAGYLGLGIVMYRHFKYYSTQPVEFKKGFNLYKSYFSAFFIKINIKLYEMNSVSRVFYRDFTILPEGYEFYRMLPNSIVMLDDSPVYNETFAFQNILAVPNKYNLEL